MNKCIGLFVFLLFLHLVSCGGNSFSQFVDDPGEKATKFLEEENPNAAIKVLLEALGLSFKNIYEGITDSSSLLQAQTQLTAEVNQLVALGNVEKPELLVSILASAKAQLHGVDPFSVALALATNSSSSSAATGSTSNTNELTTLFPVLPDPTTANIRGLNIAITLLNSIGGRLSQADYYKSAIFTTSSVSLSLKALDSDGDGSISALEAINLNSDIAAEILNQLAAAAITAALGAQASDGERSTANISQITSLRAKIDAQDGADDAERLQAFISSQTTE